MNCLIAYEVSAAKRHGDWFSSQVLFY